MAKETLTVQKAPKRGWLELTAQSVTIADGFEFENDGTTLLYIANTAGAAVLTPTIQKTVDGATPSKTITVAASENGVVGPFDVGVYNDSDGMVQLTTDKDLPDIVQCVSVVKG